MGDPATKACEESAEEGYLAKLRTGILVPSLCPFNRGVYIGSFLAHSSGTLDPITIDPLLKLDTTHSVARSGGMEQTH